MRKILITGGAGFVGRRFVRRFLEAGDEVHCVDNIAKYTGGIHPDKGWPLFNPLEYANFRFYEKDCRDYFKKMADDDFDYCLHLAAIVGGRLMIDYNPLMVADDLSIDSAYWQWAKVTQPKKTICFSSSAVYPVKFQRKGSYILLSEDMVQFLDDIGKPDMTYGWSKLTHEYLAQMAFEKHGIQSVVYRPFSGYGEDQDLTYPFPSICKRVLENRNAETISVWGSGEQMRDFIYIEDCVDGVLATMDKINDASPLNLSTGTFTNFKSFAFQAAEILGFKPEIRGMSDKPEGTYARAGDTVKQRNYGFQYRVDFREGIKKALQYFEEQGV